MYFADISTDNGTTYDLEAETLEALASELPESFRGTARAVNAQGSVVGYIGRDLFTGAAHWKTPQ